MRRITKNDSTVTEPGLISSDEILDAARHRLRNWSPEQIEAGIAALSSQDGRHGDRSAWVVPSDRRDPSSATSALLVLLADARGDAVLLFQAGHGVIESYRQAQRGSAEGRVDALDALLRAAIAELPSFTPAILWAEFARRASMKGNGALADYDSLSNLISFEPYSGAALKDINPNAFRRRVQRLRKNLLRQQPVDVAVRVYAGAK